MKQKQKQKLNMWNVGNMEVEIMWKKLVSPLPKTDHPRKLKLSCIDQLAPPIYVCCVFYYENDQESRDASKQRLEASLAETLSVFYPLAGRYVEQDLSVDCSDQGVGLLDGRVKGEIKEVVAMDGKALARLVPPYEPHSPTAPLLSVQLNSFDCGGFAIGLKISHLVADGYSVALFVNAWATICRLGKIDQIPRLRFDLESIFPSRDIFEGSKYKPPSQPHSYNSHVNVVTTRFVFDAEAISRLRLRLKDATASRVQLVTGLVWRALMRASQAGHEKPRASLASHALNMRGKTSLPIPNHSCGNLYRLVLAKFKPNHETKDLAILVKDAVREAGAEMAKPWLDQNDLFFITRNVWSEWKEASNNMDTKDGANNVVDVFDFTSWCKMGCYEADFGWGRPWWVSSIHIPVDGIVVFHDTRNGDGIEAWANLAQDKMIAFEQDEEIVAFTK